MKNFDKQKFKKFFSYIFKIGNNFLKRILTLLVKSKDTLRNCIHNSSHGVGNVYFIIEILFILN